MTGHSPAAGMINHGGGYVSNSCVGQSALFMRNPGDPRSGPSRFLKRVMAVVQNACGRCRIRIRQHPLCLACSLGGECTVPKTIHDHEKRTIGGGSRAPSIPAQLFPAHRERNNAEGKRLRGALWFWRPKLRYDAGAERGRGIQVEHRGQSANRAQAIATRSIGGISVFERCAHIRDSGPIINRQKAQTRGSIQGQFLAQKFSVAGMLDEVGCHLCNGNRDFPAIVFIHAQRCGVFQNQSPRVPHLGRVEDINEELRLPSSCYFHRMTVTFVPSPTRDFSSNSLTNRLLPPSPRPSPEPVVKPPRSARSMSGIPGPLSSKIRRIPIRGPLSVANSIRPPRPWITVLRASSLAAVTTLV